MALENGEDAIGIAIQGEGEGDNIVAQAAEGVFNAAFNTASIFEDLRRDNNGSGVHITAGLIDTVFGMDCTEALAKSRAGDPLFATAYKLSESFKNSKATVQTDGLLRFDNRIVVPLQFR
ncbi:hypothetical protein HDV00_009800 [Rhizophlyctis rosea]|nr:hypothetical protein HDV00_009800 [Rhizophlyctis rosea]